MLYMEWEAGMKNWPELFISLSFVASGTDHLFLPLYTTLMGMVEPGPVAQFVQYGFVFLGGCFLLHWIWKQFDNKQNVNRPY